MNYARGPWKLVEREERDGIAWDVVDANGESVAAGVACPPK